MKDNRSQNSNQTQQVRGDRQNKDNIDSRKNEEQDTKGSDITNNRKEVHSDKANTKSRR